MKDLVEVRDCGKKASTRLLDLLAGWSTFVSADEENHVEDPAVSAEEIGALYQLAGELSEGWEQSSLEEQQQAISAFLQEHVLPLMLRTNPST